MRHVIEISKEYRLGLVMDREEIDMLTTEIDYLLSLNSSQRGATMGMNYLPEIYNALMEAADDEGEF